ncbi:MAG: aa3-type cytochrome c oxidase subunit IV [Micropepsaceae bacterium]
MADGEYVQGSMDITEQKATFNLFYSLTKWGSILVGIAVVLLAVTRTNAVDCSKADLAAAHINACGKLPAHGAEGAEH